jgi:hypothetical protein
MAHLPFSPNQDFPKQVLQAKVQSADTIVLYDLLQHTGKPPDGM